MFRLLGLHQGTDISTAAAAALLGTPTDTAQPHLHTLADLHLVERSADSRYRFHDLLRAYADERAMPTERADAIPRMLTWYLHTADAACRVARPEQPLQHGPLQPLAPHCEALAFEDFSAALSWCDLEHSNLAVAVNQAAELGHHTIAWQLSAVINAISPMRRYWPEWLSMDTTALASARRCDDPKAHCP